MLSFSLFTDNVLYATGNDCVTITKAEQKLARAAVEENYESIIEPYSHVASANMVKIIMYCMYIAL